MKCIDCPYYDEFEHCCIRNDDRCVEDDYSEEQEYLREQREQEELWRENEVCNEVEN